MTVPSSQELIQSVIDHFKRHPERLGKPPTPIAPEVLEKLTFPDGKPLPPSLKQWLAFDTASLDLFSDVANLVITPIFLSDWGGIHFNTMQRLLLPDNLYTVYKSSENSMWFLYTGQADDAGEYPILAADLDDDDYVNLVAPNFAVWMADHHHLLRFNLYPYGHSLFGHPDYRTAMREQSALNFRGNRICWTDGEAIAINGTTTRWCSEDEVIVDLRKQGIDDEWINIILGKHK